MAPFFWVSASFGGMYRARPGRFFCCALFLFFRAPGGAAAVAPGRGLGHNRLMSKPAEERSPPDTSPGQRPGGPPAFEGRRRARRLALAVLGLTHIAAFASFGVQLEGLVGAEGIMPAADFLERAGQYFTGRGESPWANLPSLAWITGASDGVMTAFCVLGALCGGLLVAGVVPRLALFVAWALYLSLLPLGSPFLSYQWDILLLEVSFVGLFYAPRGWRPRPSTGEAEPPAAGVWLMRLVLFKLMLMSGAVKLTSGDPTWQDLTALDYHYWTQPIPHPLAWFAHNLPDWTRSFSVLGNHFAELFAPWLVLFAPRGWRLFAWGVGIVLIMAWGVGDLGAVHVLCGGLLTVALGWRDRHRSRWPAALVFTGLLLTIAGTGNYGFFHLLTFALVLTLLHDGDLSRLVGRPLAWARARGWANNVAPPSSEAGPAAPRWLRRVTLAAAVVIVPLSAAQLGLRLGGGTLRAWERGDAELSVVQRLAYDSSKWARAALDPVRQLHSINGYGLFARMTTTRYELIVEGTDDGQRWRAYRFVYKPDTPDAPLRFAGLHMPRLDWQMWFAALTPRCRGNWSVAFVRRLLEGSPAVKALLAHDPFPDAPPRAIRIRRVDTRFTTPAEREASGDVWAFDEAGTWCRPLTTDDFAGR